MKLILTRDQHGIVKRVVLDDVMVTPEGDGHGVIDLTPFVNAIQITDKPPARPIVGLELLTYDALDLVQVGGPEA